MMGRLTLHYKTRVDDLMTLSSISNAAPAICRVFTKISGQNLGFEPQNMPWGDSMPNMLFLLHLCIDGYIYNFFAFLFKSTSSIRVVCSFSVFLCMSPVRSGYKELGLNLVEPLQYQPRKR